jgi:hypothetical protein
MFISNEYEYLFIILKYIIVVHHNIKMEIKF